MMTPADPCAEKDRGVCFTESLDDAETLLKYAAGCGIDVDDATRASVLNARAACRAGWTPQITDDLLAALTRLAATLKPVTAESLRSLKTHPILRNYWVVIICLAVVIIPFSVASFISSAVSDSIRKDISSANDLAVKLTTELEPPNAVPASPSATAQAPALPPGISPVDLVTDLQTFASLIRGIYARSQQLDLFVGGAVRDPFSNMIRSGEYKHTFQLPVPLPADLRPILTGRIVVLQDARSFGQDVIDDVSIFYGAMATCILPVLYALLGTCAYLLRSFSEEMKTRTFVPSHSDSARFLIAAIGGAVVGLFGNLSVNQGTSVSPFAIAFVVGYSVDVFFSFLESFIQAFTRTKSTAPPAQEQAPPPAAKAASAGASS